MHTYMHAYMYTYIHIHTHTSINKTCIWTISSKRRVQEGENQQEHAVHKTFSQNIISHFWGYVSIRGQGSNCVPFRQYNSRHDLIEFWIGILQRKVGSTLLWVSNCRYFRMLKKLSKPNPLWACLTKLWAHGSLVCTWGGGEIHTPFRTMSRTTSTGRRDLKDRSGCLMKPLDP
jgi:hypothetical protein